MSHGDKVTQLPEGFVALAKSGNSPFAAMGDMQRKYFGVQFHPEVHHTPNGIELLKHFAIDICGAKPDWTPASIIDEASNGFVSRSAMRVSLRRFRAAWIHPWRRHLVHKAIGDQLVCVFVDTGLLRANEGEQVASAFRGGLGAELITVEASDDFLGALKGQTDPEQKRKIVGEKFIRIFEREAKNVGQPNFWCKAQFILM
jgi:GMP synthase (glutamine-hydrolysing)